MNKKFSSIFAGAALLFSQSAWANEAVVTPFLPKSVNSLVALNITSLVASELDFMSEYDMVEQLEQAPSSLNLSCITRSSCLGPIGSTAGASHVFAGSVGKAGSDAFELKLVLFDVPSNTFVRQKTFRVPSAPDRMADTMGGIVRELVTGKSQVQTQQEESVASADDFSMDEDDDFGDFGDDDISHRVGVPGNSNRQLEDDPFDSELEDRRQAEEEAQRRAEAEERRRAEAEERQRAEEESRRRAEQERIAREEARRAEEERLAWQREEEDRRREEARFDEEDRRSDLDEIQFGAVAEDDIGIDDIQFGSAVSNIMVNETSTESAGYEDDLDDYGDLDDWNDDYRSDDSGYDSLDSLDREPSSTGRSSRNESSASRSGRSSASVQISSRYKGKESRLGVAVRGGYASLRGQSVRNETTGEMLRTSLGFVTYGAEVEVPLSGGATFRGGLEGHSTQRTVPEKLRHMGLPDSIWNTITPIHAGVAYQFGKATVRPNIGAELLATPYSKEGFKMALGLRGRVGLDLMTTRSFGVRIDGSMGFLYGSDFEMIESGLSSTTMAPQISFGTLFLL